MTGEGWFPEGLERLVTQVGDSVGFDGVSGELTTVDCNQPLTLTTIYECLGVYQLGQDHFLISMQKR